MWTNPKCVSRNVHHFSVLSNYMLYQQQLLQTEMVCLPLIYHTQLKGHHPLALCHWHHFELLCSWPVFLKNSILWVIDQCNQCKAANATAQLLPNISFSLTLMSLNAGLAAGSHSQQASMKSYLKEKLCQINLDWNLLKYVWGTKDTVKVPTLTVHSPAVLLAYRAYFWLSNDWLLQDQVFPHMENLQKYIPPRVIHQMTTAIRAIEWYWYSRTTTQVSVAYCFKTL